MLKQALRSRWAQIAVAWLLGAYLHFALRTTRWRFLGAEHLPRGEPAIIAFWHECLALMPMMWLQSRKRGVPGQAFVLVSRHRDGRLIGDVLRHFKAGVVHGSSSAGGAAGVRRLLAVLQQNDYVVITPDGPRGPSHVAAPGAVQLAAASGAAILPAAACTRRGMRLRTWDRMLLPLPFGRGVILCGAPITVPREQASGMGDRLATALNHLAAKAETLCRA